MLQSIKHQIKGWFMWLQAALVKTSIAVSLSLGLFASALASDNYNCTQLMYEHGLATSAQLHCGYKDYSEAVISKVSQCMALAEENGESDRLKETLKEGLADFQAEYEEANSKKEICSGFADQFSLFVRP